MCSIHQENSTECISRPWRNTVVGVDIICSTRALRTCPGLGPVVNSENLEFHLKKKLVFH